MQINSGSKLLCVRLDTYVRDVSEPYSEECLFYKLFTTLNYFYTVIWNFKSLKIKQRSLVVLICSTVYLFNIYRVVQNCTAKLRKLILELKKVYVNIGSETLCFLFVGHSVFLQNYRWKYIRFTVSVCIMLHLPVFSKFKNISALRVPVTRTSVKF